jgi:hypothetical protein
MVSQLLALQEPYQGVEHVPRAHLRHRQGHCRPMMDAELHHVPDGNTLKFISQYPKIYFTI